MAPAWPGNARRTRRRARVAQRRRVAPPPAPTALIAAALELLLPPPRLLRLGRACALARHRAPRHTPPGARPRPLDRRHDRRPRATPAPQRHKAEQQEQATAHNLVPPEDAARPPHVALRVVVGPDRRGTLVRFALGGHGWILRSSAWRRPR